MHDFKITACFRSGFSSPLINFASLYSVVDPTTKEAVDFNNDR